MGCTSSAPNTTPNKLQSNPTDNSITILEEEHGENMKEVIETMQAVENGTNEIKVLPSCDTLAEPIQLDSNKKSMIDAFNLDLEKDFPTNPTEKMENESMPKDDNDIEQSEERLSSLEEVVEKVVELYGVKNVLSDEEIPGQEQNLESVLEEISDKEKKVDTYIKHSHEIEELESETNEQIHEAEQSSSPTQSTSSRATRWEALADVAAELPPSLAVDPLTGQIYTVTK